MSNIDIGALVIVSDPGDAYPIFFTAQNGPK